MASRRGRGGGGRLPWVGTLRPLDLCRRKGDCHGICGTRISARSEHGDDRGTADRCLHQAPRSVDNELCWSAWTHLPSRVHPVSSWSPPPEVYDCSIQLAEQSDGGEAGGAGDRRAEWVARRWVGVKRIFRPVPRSRRERHHLPFEQQSIVVVTQTKILAHLAPNKTYLNCPHFQTNSVEDEIDLGCSDRTRRFFSTKRILISPDTATPPKSTESLVSTSPIIRTLLGTSWLVFIQQEPTMMEWISILSLSTAFSYLHRVSSQSPEFIVIWYENKVNIPSRVLLGLFGVQKCFLGSVVIGTAVWSCLR